MNPAYLIFFFGAAAANLALTPLFMRLAARYGFLDRPGHRKIHDQPIPKVGGLAIVASALVSVALGLFTFGEELHLTPDREIKIALVLGVTLLFTLLGFLDDVYDIRPRHKLAYQALILGMFVVFGFHFVVLHIPGTKPLDLSFLGYPLTLFWLLAVVNGFNFLDGIDGLAGSLALVILGGMGCLSYLLSGPNHVGILLLAFLGAVMVFLLFNWRPAKVYLGDAGSNALGAFIGVGLVSLGSAQPALTHLLAPPPPVALEAYRFQVLAVSLLAGYPLIEVLLTFFRRGSRMYFFGRSMENPEQEHIHHQFLKMGFRSGTISLAVALFQAVLSIAGVLATVRQNALAIWLLAPLAMVIAYLAPRGGFLDFLSMKDIRTKPHFMIANYFISMQKVKLQLSASREEILALLSQVCREFGIRCFSFRVRGDGEGKGGMNYLYRDRVYPVKTSEKLIHLGEKTLPGEYYDYCDGPGLPGDAFWIFVSHVGDDELDVEYRVLVNGFMREALERAARLGEGREYLDFSTTDQLPHQHTSGYSLRKRATAKLN